MATSKGTHVTYQPTGVDGPTISRTFSSEVNALRSAVKNDEKYVFINHDETLPEALARTEGR